MIQRFRGFMGQRRAVKSGPYGDTPLSQPPRYFFTVHIHKLKRQYAALTPPVDTFVKPYSRRAVQFFQKPLQKHAFMP